MFHNRLMVRLLAAIWTATIFGCADGVGISTPEMATSSPSSQLSLNSAVPLIIADGSDKASSTYAYWENSHNIMQVVFQQKENPRGLYHPSGMPPRLNAEVYREIATKLENLSARGVDEDALNAWSQVSAACKTMAAFEDYAGSSGQMISDAAKGSVGDYSGIVGNATARMDSVAKEFLDAEAEISRVRRLLESRYVNQQFIKTRVH